MNKIEEFRQRIKKTLVDMDAKVSHLQTTTGEARTLFIDFKTEMSEFMQFYSVYRRSNDNHG